MYNNTAILEENMNHIKTILATEDWLSQMISLYQYYAVGLGGYLLAASL